MNFFQNWDSKMLLNLLKNVPTQLVDVQARKILQ